MTPEVLRTYLARVQAATSASGDEAPSENVIMSGSYRAGAMVMMRSPYCCAPSPLLCRMTASA